MENRLTMVAAALVICFAMLVANIAIHMKNGSYADAAVQQRLCTVTAGEAQGTIYDRNGTALVNQTVSYRAVIIPTEEALTEVLPHLRTVSGAIRGIREGMPFCAEVDTDTFASPDIIVFSVPERRTEQLLAQHVIGYTSQEGDGVTGLEADYERILRGTEDIASVTYTMDAAGNVLLGTQPVIHPLENSNAGLMTTLDSRIQQIVEEEGSGIRKGAIVVMEVESGDVLAMASFPSYTPQGLAQALEDPDSPLINRCLYSYSVGSIFKLVTCAAAYAQGETDFSTECAGHVEISGQYFRCHDWKGHGEVDMKQAMIYSCNTYFIRLSERLDPTIMRETAQNLGFGTQIALSGSIVSSAGTLPSAQDMLLPAEKANFSFGQGMLTATPLQITQMTCGIANNGAMPVARLIKGITLDGTTAENEKPPMHAQAMPRNMAYFLQNMMEAAVNESDSSNAVPELVFAAAKTSTAQTGRYDENGVEYCHAWITGYFPIGDPQYAVTVLVEDGGFGNDAAAPVFREIADRITAECQSSTQTEKISQNN